ncbi:hypothetical protein SAY86_029084 [Trapa natans]|uniref:Uncharacterized protein n=1 Tax=Trapa natans TaxID=22666 RepID=A0AAN7RH06_TRANT|nr:hypothetical protein SAY86_029084 [Trapa natans]
MQQIEVELRAQIIARSKIADFKKCCSAEVQGLMKEKVHEKEQHMIQTLQRIVEEKDKELIAVKNDNEAKQRQIIELQEQYRVSQENITSKDEQLMNAKEWPMQFQAVDAWQLGSLQAELQGQTTHPQEIDGPQSHCIQESEGEIEQQQALPETSFYKKSGRGRIRMLDECLVHPASENDVQENAIDCNRIHALIGDANNIGGNLRYKDITGADIIGMRFESFEAAEDFYRRYSIAIGFSIRKQDLRRKPTVL